MIALPPLASSCRSSALQAAPTSPEDVVIVSALRTPITRAKKGGLKDTPADDLLATLLKATVDRTGLDPKDVGDVVVGSVLGNSSQRANECRIAMFLAGFPQEVPVRTVNRQCSSGEVRPRRARARRTTTEGTTKSLPGIETRAAPRAFRRTNRGR